MKRVLITLAVVGVVGHQGVSRAGTQAAKATGNGVQILNAANGCEAAFTHVRSEYIAKVDLKITHASLPAALVKSLTQDIAKENLTDVNARFDGVNVTTYTYKNKAGDETLASVRFDNFQTYKIEIEKKYAKGGVTVSFACEVPDGG